MAMRKPRSIFALEMTVKQVACGFRDGGVVRGPRDRGHGAVGSRRFAECLDCVRESGRVRSQDNSLQNEV